MKNLLFLLTILISLSSCLNETKEIDNDKVIVDYLKKHDRVATKNAYGLYYNIVKEGTGDYPTLDTTILAQYTGYFTDNVVFDSTNGDTLVYRLKDLIPGWQIGLPYIKPGGEITLYIPPYLGYGEGFRGSYAINSVLIFDIKLLGLK